MPQRRPVEKIHAAAYHSVCISPKIQDIADAFGVSPDAVRKWRKTPEWANAVKVFGGEGNDAIPTRDSAREQGEAFENAKKIYIELYRELTAKGETLRRLPRLVEERTSIPRRTIYEWAKRYDWQGEAERQLRGDAE